MPSVDEQIDFLTSLGKRLDRWTSPGDSEDRLGDRGALLATPLWDEFARKFLTPPARVIDVLLVSWIVIKDFQTQESVAFLLNPAQRFFEREFIGRDIILKAGRAGFSTLFQMKALLKTMMNVGYTAVAVTYDLQQAKDDFLGILYAFNHFGGQLGEELREGALKPNRENTRELYFPQLNSHFFVDTAGTFAPAQGSSIQFLIGDEMARWLKGDPHQVIGTLLSHVTGIKSEVALLSRPFGDTGEFYDRYWAAKRGQDNFRSHFCPWFWNPSQLSKVPPGFTLTEEELILQVKYKEWRAGNDMATRLLPPELTPGKFAWRRDNQKELRDLFPQEFAEDVNGCFIGSGNCPFDAIASDKVKNDTTPIVEREQGAGEGENGLIIWHKPEPPREIEVQTANGPQIQYVYDDWFVLFIDPAGTLWQSRMAMELISGKTGEQHAEWVGRCDAATGGAIAAKIAKRWGRVIVACETNLGEISVTLVSKLIEEEITSDANCWPHQFQEQDSGGQWRLGWKTDGGNRPEMLDNLAVTWCDHPELFHSARLLSEIKNHERKGDRIQPKKGTTGDLVMAAAGAHKVRQISKVPVYEPVIEFIRPPRRQRDDRGWQRIG